MRKENSKIEEDMAWVNYRSAFSDVYDSTNYDGSLQSWVMSQGHKALEREYEPNVCFDNVLEVGAGTCEHLKHVRHRFKNYIVSDIDERAISAGLKKIQNYSVGNVSIAIHSANNLPYENEVFDRVIATHILEHLINPHDVLKEWKRVLKKNGTLSILIPSDPGLMWRLGRSLGPRKKAIKQGFHYDYIMAREHVNSSYNLLALIKFYFPQANLRWWPTKISVVDANLFIYCNVQM